MIRKWNYSDKFEFVESIEFWFAGGDKVEFRDTYVLYLTKKPE